MTTPKYVQHKSKTGPKYKLDDAPWNKQEKASWEVTTKHPDGLEGTFYLPRSEYLPCPPPRRRVTGELKYEEYPLYQSFFHYSPTCVMTCNKPYTAKLVTREELSPGEVCIVIEEGE